MKEIRQIRKTAENLRNGADLDRSTLADKLEDIADFAAEMMYERDEAYRVAEQREADLDSEREAGKQEMADRLVLELAPTSNYDIVMPEDADDG